MTLLPPEYHARCTLSSCTWAVTTPDADYRNTLATQHTTRYGHATQRTDAR